jgi:hypothetical protein
MVSMKPTEAPPRRRRGSAGRWKRWRADPCCASHALPAGCALQRGNMDDGGSCSGPRVRRGRDIVIVMAVHKVGRRRTRLAARARQAASGASPFTHGGAPSAASCPLRAPSHRLHRSIAHAVRLVVLLRARGPRESLAGRRQGRVADARRNHSAPFRSPREPARCARLGSHDTAARPLLRERSGGPRTPARPHVCCPVPACVSPGPSQRCRPASGCWELWAAEMAPLGPACSPQLESRVAGHGCAWRSVAGAGQFQRAPAAATAQEREACAVCPAQGPNPLASWAATRHGAVWRWSAL